MLHNFALSLHSWRLLFATSFGPALLTVIHPRYSAQERVEGVEHSSEGWGVWPWLDVRPPHVRMKVSRVGVWVSRTRSIPLSSSEGRLLLMVEAMLKPRETSGTSR